MRVLTAEQKLARRRYVREWERRNKDKVRAWQRKHYLRNPQKYIRQSALWRKANSERYRAHQIKVRYGVSADVVRAAIARQQGKCGICQEDLKLSPSGLTNKFSYLDHDHRTGRFRGVLCPSCNHGMGFVDRVGWLENANKYLEGLA